MTIIRFAKLSSLFIVLAVNACAQPIVLPYEASIRGTDGFPVYVDDSVVQDRVPWLKDVGPRLSTCLSGMTIPEFLTVVYPPQIVGPHKVETNVLRCTHEKASDHFECDAQPIRSLGIFEVDPDRYFNVERVPDDESLAVVRDVITGRIKFDDGVTDPHLAEHKGLLGTLSPTANGYVIDYGDCGCSGQMLLHRNDVGEFIVTQAGIRMCI